MDNIAGSLPDTSCLKKLTKMATSGGIPQELGVYLTEDEEMELIATQGRISNTDSSTSYHFVTYFNIEGTIWEIDGRRKPPLSKVGTAHADFGGLRIAELLQRYIQIEDGLSGFSLMALAPPDEDEAEEELKK